MGLVLLVNIGSEIGFIIRPLTISRGVSAIAVASVFSCFVYLTHLTTVPDLLRFVPTYSSALVRRLEFAEAIVTAITAILPWVLIAQVIVALFAQSP